MRILILGTTAASMDIFRKDLIKKLSDLGYEVYAFAIDYDDFYRKKILSYGGNPVDYNLSRAGFNPFIDILNTIKLYKKIKKLKPDIVFSYFSKPSIFGTLAAKLAGVKNINAMLEGLGYFFTPSSEMKRPNFYVVKNILIFLYRLSFKFLDNLILLNKDDESDLIREHNINVKNIFILGPIGLNTEEYPYSEPPLHPISFIFVARLLKEKGVYEFIEAAKIVKSKYPEVKFFMLGDLDISNPGSLLLENINELKSSGLIEFTGHVTDVQDWIVKASVFVLPSYREGFPRSTQEAMTMGRAVITSDVPGCRETVIDGVNGYLTPVRDAEKLAEKMFRFILNPHQIQKMGLASHKIALEKFDSSVTTNKLINIFQLHNNKNKEMFFTER